MRAIACAHDLVGGGDARFPSTVCGRKIAEGAGLASEKEPVINRCREHGTAASHSGNCI